MPILKFIKITLAVVFAVVGLFGLYQMFRAEVSTANQFANYFKWAFYGGMVFVAVGAAWTVLDRDDEVVTSLVDESGKR